MPAGLGYPQQGMGQQPQTRTISMPMGQQPQQQPYSWSITPGQQQGQQPGGWLQRGINQGGQMLANGFQGLNNLGAGVGAVGDQFTALRQALMGQQGSPPAYQYGNPALINQILSRGQQGPPQSLEELFVPGTRGR